MDSRTFYYARVSSKEQNLDRQLSAFASLGASERDIVIDKESGKSLDRQGYTALKTAMLRSGDTLVIKSLDRLSRNKADIKNELQYFKDHGIRLKVLDLPTTMIEYPSGQEWVLDMAGNVVKAITNLHRPCRQFIIIGQAIVDQKIERLCRLFQIENLSPLLVTGAFSGVYLSLNINEQIDLSSVAVPDGFFGFRRAPAPVFKAPL